MKVWNTSYNEEVAMQILWSLTSMYLHEVKSEAEPMEKNSLENQRTWHKIKKAFHLFMSLTISKLNASPALYSLCKDRENVG